MVVKYCKPNLHQITQHNKYLVSTPAGGYVVLDERVLDIWDRAGGKTLSEIEEELQSTELSRETIRATLACLAEADLLNRESESQSKEIEYPDLEDNTLVSLIVVVTTEKELEWFGECLASISAQTHKSVETLIIDNATEFDFIGWLENRNHRGRVLHFRNRLKFSDALNQGVCSAIGDYFLFLNRDTRLEPGSIAEMVECAEMDNRCAAVATKLKFWYAPQFLNGLGNSVSDFAWGSDNAIGHLDLGQFDNWENVPSACFAAALITRKSWEDVGPIDEGFPAYYEDSEWCYRARMLGYQVYVAPKAVVFHVFGGWWRSENEEGDLSAPKLRNVVYGRLRFATKIVGSPLVRRFLRNYLMEDWTNFLLAIGGRKWNHVKAYLSGWGAFLGDISSILTLRRQLQAMREVSDEILFSSREEIPQPLVWNGMPELNLQAIHDHYLPAMLSKRTPPMPEFEGFQYKPHVLVVSNDVVDVKMAGPGMRYLEVARALSVDMDVTLAVPSESSLAFPNLSIVRYWEDRPRSLQILVENCDIAVISGYMVQKFPFLTSTDRRLVVDLHNPFIFENLHHHLDESLRDQEILNTHAVEITNQLAKIGDFYICGNDRQRDLWMGFLAANGRVNPKNFAVDQNMLDLIDVVSMGLPERPPEPGPILKGVHPQVPDDSHVVLWEGGLWNWLDPLSLIEAWPKVLESLPRARLVFTGTRHPNPQVPAHKMVERSIALATDLGEIDRSILFVDWLPYEEREKALCEANIGVVLHPLHLETRYSIRTRVLDYIWADLPILVTEGDVTSEWVEQYQLGKVVPPFDPESIAKAIIDVIKSDKESWRMNFEPLKEDLQWSKVIEPLRNYCLEGEHAPDWKLHRKLTLRPPPIGLRRFYLRRAWTIYRTEGLRALLRRIWTRIQLRFRPY